MKKPTIKYLGTVALVRLPLNTSVDVKSLAEKIMASNKSVKTVLTIERIHSQHRIPVVKHVAGSTNTETIVREDGLIFELDAARLMFSLGNSFERRRIRAIVQPGEVVVDMFAGVGQFSIPAAKAPSKYVYAFEINSYAYRYLCENIRLNGVSDKVTAFNEDCRNALEKGLRGVADRILMGYLKGTADYLSTAIHLANPDGGIIHFHEIADTRDGGHKLYDLCRKIAEENGFSTELLEKRIVKTYSPRMAHWVLDLRVRRRSLLEPSSDLAQ